MDGEYLSINTVIWKLLFDHVMNPIIEHTQKMLQEEAMNGCKYLFLTGGLSASPYYQERMKAAFGSESDLKLRVVTTDRPLLSVAAGAAYFGLSGNVPSYDNRPKLIPVDREFKLSIAVDFGTDGIGMAYAFNDDIHVHSKWSANKYGDQVKPKNIILIDENANPIGFGMDAKDMLSIC